jgi:hypothetical protein
MLRYIGVNGINTAHAYQASIEYWETLGYCNEAHLMISTDVSVALKNLNQSQILHINKIFKNKNTHNILRLKTSYPSAISADMIRFAGHLPHLNGFSFIEPSVQEMEKFMSWQYAFKYKVYIELPLTNYNMKVQLYEFLAPRWMVNGDELTNPQLLPAFNELIRAEGPENIFVYFNEGTAVSLEHLGYTNICYSLNTNDTVSIEKARQFLRIAVDLLC